MTISEQCQALRTGAALGVVASRKTVGIRGKDRAAFLQGLLTNDIAAVAAGSGCYAAWLTPQGRMLTDAHLFESGDMMLMDVPVAELEPTLARLDQFLFGEDVQFADLSKTLETLSIHGPTAPAVLERTLSGVADLGTWQNYRNARASWGEAPVVVARLDQLAVPGFCIYLEPERAAGLRTALVAAGCVELEAAAIEVARIEAGYPIFGVDMTHDTIPLEAGIEDRAISTTKGCYVGQEVIIRVLHRGQGRVAKRLMALRIEGGLPSVGAKLYIRDKESGWVTSAAESPRFGSIALAYVQRDASEPGTRLEVDTPEGRAAAVVSARPLA
jgi:folate-binding protein YgfZ